MKDRSAVIDQIVAAARRPVPDIVEKREVQGTDGKWYGGGGMPIGVNCTDEVRTVGYVFRAANGTTYGTRAPMREALTQEFNEREDRNQADFRAELEKMNETRIASQAEYWLGGKK